MLGPTHSRRGRAVVPVVAGILLLAGCGSDAEQGAAGVDPDPEEAELGAEAASEADDDAPGSGGQPDLEPAAAAPGGVHAAGEELRVLEAGMEWTYDLQGELQLADGSMMDMGGTVFIKIVERELDGDELLALEVTQFIAPVGLSGPPPAGPPPGSGAPDEEESGPSFFGPDADPTTYFYFVQDRETRDVVLIGDSMGRDGDRRTVDEGAVFIPGHFRDGMSYDNRLDWGGDEHTDNWFEVAGTEVISTELGDFEAWIAPNTSTGTDGIEVAGTDWWNAQLGQPVRFHALTKVPGGVELDLTALLRETNVDLG